MEDFTSTYFRHLVEIAGKYEADRAVRMEERMALVEAHDREGIERWEKREATIERPYSNGECAAYKAWDESSKGYSEFVVSRLPWDRDTHDFIVCLRKAGVAEIVITAEDCHLIRFLHAFAGEGCTVTGLCKVTHTKCRFGMTTTETHEGIKMAL